MACNKHAIDEAYKILSNYQDSEHCYEKGEKQKRFILTFICCVDTKYGNTNALTDEWFLGKDGFFFKDVDENIYKTNSKSFNSFSDDHDLIEGMNLSFTANVSKNAEFGYVKQCKYTQLNYVTDVDILSYPENPCLTKEEKERDLKESKRIERGPNGEKVKEHFEDECQICKAQGITHNYSFIKENGRQYSEAHHVIPLSQNGSDLTDNIMCLCANHHRQMHYGDVKVNFDHYNFYVTLDGERLKPIPRWRMICPYN